jgi:DNA-binding MarR family transcriptional regulator
MMDVIDNLLREIFSKYLRPKGMPPHPDLTTAQMHCLVVIGELKNPTMSELSEELGVHPSTATALIDALVEHGLVERHDDPSDRRIVRVTHTEQGRRERLQHHRRQRERLARLLGEINDEDLAAIVNALRILRDAAARAVQADSQTPKRLETDCDDSAQCQEEVAGHECQSA